MSPAKQGPNSLDDVFSNGRFSARQTAVLAICVLVAMTEGYDVQAMAFAAPILAQDWGLQAKQIGMLLTASVLGIALGSIALAPLGDRIGRRTAMLIGLVLASVFTLAGALAGDVPTLFVVRLAAGLGLGLAMPNLIALAMETAPTKWRTLAIVAVSCGYPLGAGFGGGAASAMVHEYGASAVFMLGGVATLVAAAVAFVGLVESPYFLQRDPKNASRLTKSLKALGAAALETAPAVLTGAQRKTTVAELFTPERRATTSLLWLLNFANIAMVYFFISWLPSLLSYRGLSSDAALVGTSVFNAAGVIGGLALAFSVRRLGAAAVLAIAYVLAAGGVAALGLLSGTGGSMLASIAVAGAGILGSQFCLTAVVNHYYPSEIRVGAAGYALGVGRLGAVVAPMVGATLLSLAGAVEQVFLIMVVPAAVALLAVLTLRKTGTISHAA